MVRRWWKEDAQEDAVQMRHGGLHWRYKGRGGRKKWAKEKVRADDPWIGVSGHMEGRGRVKTRPTLEHGIRCEWNCVCCAFIHRRHLEIGTLEGNEGKMRS